MAASVKLAGSTYTYTVSNIQNALTLTPSNRTSRYGAVYGKPTITRQKSGSANTRYFVLSFVPVIGGAAAAPARELGYYQVAYSATFTKTGTTATVTEINAGSRPALSYIAREMSVPSTSGYLYVDAYDHTHFDSSDPAYQPFAMATGSASFAMSGWNPGAPSISFTLSQFMYWTVGLNELMSADNPSEEGWYELVNNEYVLSQDTTIQEKTYYKKVQDHAPDPAIFGYIAGYARGSWAASGNPGNWSPVVPYGTLTLSANGESDSSGAYGQSISVGLPTQLLGGSNIPKLITATSVTGTAKLANNIGGSATRTATVTVQPYTKPVVSGLAIGRTAVNNEANHASMSVGWVVDALNKDSNVQQGITSGAITATWEAEDLSDQGTVFASGVFDIISNGNAMTDVTGTKTATLVDTSGSNHNVYDPDKSYKFSVYITDRIGENSATITAILNSNFYIICVREGGRGIGFGIVPPNDEFYVNMPANFQELTRSGSGTQADPYVYSGGINDEALLDADTIQAIENLLSS